MTSTLQYHGLSTPNRTSNPIPFEPKYLRTTELTFAILVPDRDILHLYSRPETGRLRYRAALRDHQLLERLNIISPPSAVALAGNVAANRVSRILLPHYDLFVVPDPWLRHIPLRHLDRRARTTARLVHAHLINPIQLRLAPTPDDVPF